MSNFFYCLILVGVTFMLGLVVGEAKAPISGMTVQALTLKASALEEQITNLSVRYDALSVEVHETCGFRDAGF